MIKVLIVDDSPSAAAYIAGIFTSDPDFAVVGTADCGTKAIRLVEQLKPDIISMDFNMPDMDGFEVTRRLMASMPTPIVIVSALYDSRTVEMTFQALEAGALAILAKPPARTSQSFPLRSYELLMTFKAMAGVKVARRLAKPALPSAERTASPPPAAPVEIRLIAIGASTGGPQVVHEILSHLSPAIRVPIVIVQHISPGFEAGFAAWLDHSTGLPVAVAASGEQLKDGHVYIAPTGYHLELSREGLVILVRGPLEHGVCPSVSRFFRSVARSYGKAAIGVILTGMGTDGAAELKLMREAGAVTIAQDKETSVVHGMPGEAIRLGGAVHILAVNAIAAKISALLHPG